MARTSSSWRDMTPTERCEQLSKSLIRTRGAATIRAIERAQRERARKQRQARLHAKWRATAKAYEQARAQRQQSEVE